MSLLFYSLLISCTTEEDSKNDPLGDTIVDPSTAHHLKQSNFVDKVVSNYGTLPVYINNIYP
jgi:hypothetical protein